MRISEQVIARAEGCFLGQVAGDSLGSLVEFQTRESIAAQYPDGVRELADGGPWNLLAGQPTDDSEMALMLARSLVKEGGFKAKKVLQSYQYWHKSGPFDLGGTINNALLGQLNPESQANGALMRVCPLGIFGAGKNQEKLALWAREDAALTHINPLCQDINALYAMALAWSIENGPEPHAVYAEIKIWADQMNVDSAIREVISLAGTEPPSDYQTHMGWVMIAFQNALYQLTHSPDFENGLIETVGCGGDTDTNAAICGALLGAVHGRGSIPSQWAEKVLSCRANPFDKQAANPRPKVFWAVDLVELTDKLLNL